MKLLRPKRTFIATDTYKKSRLGVDLSLSFGMLDECFSDICSSLAQNLCFDFQCVCERVCEEFDEAKIYEADIRNPFDNTKYTLY